MVVNRFVVENRRQTKLYQTLAETLAETNRRLEQAQEEARRSERLAALGQMSAGLAHEIRNPLGVIKGSAEMLHQKLGESNPLASELAGYISSETNRLSALVTRFLDFARPLHAELVPQEITSGAGSRAAFGIVNPQGRKWVGARGAGVPGGLAAGSVGRRSLRAGIRESDSECLRCHGKRAAERCG